MQIDRPSDTESDCSDVSTESDDSEDEINDPFIDEFNSINNTSIDNELEARSSSIIDQLADPYFTVRT